MDGTLLSIRDLSAWYDRERNVLSGFSMELGQNEAVGLIGLNGAGKTTFLKTLSGLHEKFRLEGAWLHGRPAAFRDREFKTCRYFLL